MKEQIDEYFRLKDALETIKKIESDKYYDKKGWYLSGREYTSDFGLFKVSYTAGTYGSSSVSNQLRGLETKEGKQLFEKFMTSKMDSLLNEFVVFYRKNLDVIAKEQKERHEQAIKKLEEILIDNGNKP